MTKSSRLWVVCAPHPRVLVAPGERPRPGVPPCLPVHVATCGHGAELAGPWLVRAALRLPSVADAQQDPRWLGALHVRWLQHMGIAGAALYEGPPVSHWAAAAARGPGDVVVGNRKLTSVCVRRRGEDTLLVAATLLRQPPWVLLCRTLGRPGEEVRRLANASTSAAKFLGAPVDEQRWAASLRTMLHVAVELPLLRAGPPPGP